MGFRVTCLAAMTAWLATGCAGGGLMPSQSAYLNATPETVEVWLVECGRNDGDIPRKQRFCELAERSIDPAHADYGYVMGNLGNAFYRSGRWADAEKAYTRAIQAGKGLPNHANRAEMRLKLGRFAEARQDFQAAYDKTGETRYLEDIEWLDYALEAAYTYDVYLTGFSCRDIQKDSLLYPANEISIHVIAADGYFSSAVALPLHGGAYQDVNRGHVQRLNERVFNADAFDPFTLSVQMFEVDDGGPLVDAAVMYGSMLASGAAAARGMSGAGSARYLSHGSLPTKMPRGPSSPSPSLVHEAVGSALKSAFGTANDHMGGHDFTNMVATSLMEAPLRSDSGITYHFKSSHRRGGADCSVYFRVDERAMSTEQYVQAVNQIMGN